MIPDDMRPEDGWQSVDRRTVWVTALTFLGISFAAGVPTAVGIASGTSLGIALLLVVPGAVLLIVVAALIDHVRWRVTRYRVDPERVELHTGVLVRTRRTVQRNRIRSVDVTGDPLSRVFGLVSVRIGTGEQGADQGTIRLWPVRAVVGEQLRRELLGRAAVPGAQDADGHLATLDRRWIRYAPISFLTPLLGAGAFGAVLQVAQWFGVERGVIGWAIDRLEGVPIPLVVLLFVGIALVVGVVAALAVFVENWWNYRLDREPHGNLVVRRGLLTTRSMTLEEKRLRGIEVVEPLGIRTANAARVDAVATGSARQGGSGSEQREQQQSRTLLPAAPLDVALRVAAAVLREPTVPTGLTPHPVAARGRRLRWALLTVLAVEAVLVVLGLLLTDVLLHVAWIVAIPAVPAALLLALDAYRNLGHGLTERYLLVRSGATRRSTTILQRRGILGWTITQSPLQARAGLITVTATTAAGSGGYAAYDAGTQQGLVLARDTVPGLLEQFLK